MLLAFVASCTPEGMDPTRPGKPDADSTEHLPGDTVDSAEETGGTVEEPTPAIQFVGDRPHNVLIVSVDTTRRDQVGLYSGLDTTPNLDRILATGVVLEDHRTCSNWTAPSLLCAITGRWPLDDDYWPTGVYDAWADARVPVIPSGLPTLASLLSNEGYATGLITANGVFSASNTTTIIEGFDSVELGAAAPDVVTRGEALGGTLAATGQPWYMHLHFIDPHGPYVAPLHYSYELAELDASYEFPWDMRNSNDVYSLMAYWPYFTPEEEALARQYLLAVYHGELRYWDDNLAVLWAELDAQGLLDDTLVVFFSDHGEQFGEHDDFQHGQDLFAEENRVIAGFWAKNIVPGSWAGPTIHQDLSPTILDALGLSPNAEHLGTVVGLAPDDRARFSFCYLVGYCDAMMAVVKGNHHLIYEWSGKTWFYDTTADPAEETNVYDAADPDVQELWGLLQPEVEGVYERWNFLVPVGAEP